MKHFSHLQAELKVFITHVKKKGQHVAWSL